VPVAHGGCNLMQHERTAFTVWLGSKKQGNIRSWLQHTKQAGRWAAIAWKHSIAEPTNRQESDVLRLPAT